MNFTFGIITAEGPLSYHVDSVIDSIRKLNIPTYEIVVVGGNKPRGDVFVDFVDDFYLKNGWWITKKKNLITETAKYDNIVYLHDYLACDPDWYEGFKIFGEDWDVCMCKLIKLNGERYRDWCVYNRHSIGLGCDDPNLPADTINVPYDYNKTQYMYVSGAFWVAKKDFMIKYPLDENLCWGQGEDYAWVKQMRHLWNYKMNTYSTMRLLKEKP